MVYCFAPKSCSVLVGRLPVSASGLAALDVFFGSVNVRVCKGVNLIAECLCDENLPFSLGQPLELFCDFLAQVTLGTGSCITDNIFSAIQRLVFC